MKVTAGKIIIDHTISTAISSLQFHPCLIGKNTSLSPTTLTVKRICSSYVLLLLCSSAKKYTYSGASTTKTFAKCKQKKKLVKSKYLWYKYYRFY